MSRLPRQTQLIELICAEQRALRPERGGALPTRWLIEVICAEYRALRQKNTTQNLMLGVIEVICAEHRALGLERLWWSLIS